jgi:hypothetical protein
MGSTQIAGTGDTAHEQWCVVYDRRTGAVEHIHQYIALSGSDQALSEDELASQAIEQAEQASQAFEQANKRFDKDFLDVAHPADDTPLDFTNRYSVDLESGSVRYEKLSRAKPERTGE